MLPKKITDKWRADYDRQLSISERKILKKVRSFTNSNIIKEFKYL